MGPKTDTSGKDRSFQKGSYLMNSANRPYSSKEIDASTVRVEEFNSYERRNEESLNQTKSNVTKTSETGAKKATIFPRTAKQKLDFEMRRIRQEGRVFPLTTKHAIGMTSKTRKPIIP